MKPSLPLLATFAAPFLFVGVRLFLPRASIAQTQNPHPTTTLTPLVHSPTSQPIPQPAEDSVYKGWGAVESLGAVRRDSLNGYSSLWALQKSALTTAPQKFEAHLWINGFTRVGEMKVIFHSEFLDGSPCGTWDQVTVEGKDNGRLDAITTFHPPTRAGVASVWVEVQGRDGEKIGGFKKTPFAVLPLRISCWTTDWEPTAQPDEWSREIHVFAGGQAPPEWQKLKSVISAPRAYAKHLSYLSDLCQPVASIPVRLSLAPSPSIDIDTMPVVRLSSSKGQTRDLTHPPSQLIGNGPAYSQGEPRFITTQTVQWKPGGSNQLDCAQVVAQLDLPTARPAPIKGSAP